MFILEKEKKIDILQTRLASVSVNGLNDPDLRVEYVIRYCKSLIGKHMKSLAQVMPYLIYDLVGKTVLDGWSVIGELVILSWHTEINNITSYQVSQLAGLHCAKYYNISYRLSSRKPFKTSSVLQRSVHRAY